MVVAVEIGYLVAGIGKVEHIVWLLRVEHQCALVAAHGDANEVADNLVAEGFVTLSLSL